MIKKYCDECGEEIIDVDCVVINEMVYFDFNKSKETILCKECWEDKNDS